MEPLEPDCLGLSFNLNAGTLTLGRFLNLI